MVSYQLIDIRQTLILFEVVEWLLRGRKNSSLFCIMTKFSFTALESKERESSFLLENVNVPTGALLSL